MINFSAAAVAVLQLTLAVLMAFASPAVAQQSYPNKAIRFIVPFPPGGATTILSRLVGQKFTESWGEPVIVDNRGGGQTIIGTEALVKSQPDGYTILLVDNNLAVLPSLYGALPYDTLKDVAPVATISISPQLMVIHPSVAANSLQEFIALAKSRPGQLNYASGGSGALSHLIGELFNMMAGVNIQHIPYKGAGPGVTDLLAGQVQLYFIVPINVIQHIKSGKLKAIAVSGEKRISALPQVPTFTEAGLPGFDMENWFGIAAPGGTPKAVIDKLSTEVAKILGMPDIRDKLENQGMRPFISTAEQFSAMLISRMDRFAKIIKGANIKIE